jgi:rubrerythrin
MTKGETMGYPFNADEIFEIAEQIEVNGGKFYRRAAESFNKEETQNLLKGLARMEDQHKVTFAKIRENLLTKERQPVVYDPCDEAVLYLRAFAGGQVFKLNVDIDAFFTGEETLEDILHKAIGFEKDSIVFYVGIRDLVPEDLGKDQIDRIIKEEKQHIVILTKELTALNKVG